MNGVLILAILMPVSGELLFTYPVTCTGILYPYLETSGVFYISKLTNKTATLHAISCWMNDNGLGNETVGERRLMERKAAIRNAYTASVSIRRWMNPT